MANHIGTQRGVAHPGDGYSWNLFNPVRVDDGAAPFPGSVGDLFWGGITGPRYFVDPKEKLVGIVFMQGPSIRATYQAELRAMVYGAMTASRAAR
jgi:CubicO group peptidase (beta-lactamase class C family)